LSTQLLAAYVLGHTATALLTAVLGYAVVARTELVAKRWLGRYLAVLTLWSGVRAVQLLVPVESVQLVFFYADIVIPLAVIILAVIFVSEFVGKPARENWVVYAFAVVCGSLGVLAVTNWAHGFYASPTVYLEPIPHVDSGTEPGRTVAILTALVGNLVVIYYFGSLYLRSRQPVRVPLVLFAGAWGLSISPLLAQEAGLLGFETYDYTPFGIVFIAVAVAYVAYRFELDERLLIGRDTVVGAFDDPFLAVDTERRVIDYNEGAKSLLEGDDEVYGNHLSRVWPELDNQISSFEEFETTEGQTEVPTTRNGTQRYFDLNVSPIWGPRDNRQGWLLSLREITLLKNRESQLNLIRQVQSRVLRHNIRNDLSVIQVYGDAISETTSGESAEMADSITAKAESLAEVSDKVRTIEMLLDHQVAVETFDLTPRLRRIVGTIEEETKMSIILDMPDSCVVETVSELELVIEHLVENAVEHGTERSQPRSSGTESTGAHQQTRQETVSVTVIEDTNTVQIRVSDDGPGIPEAELTPLVKGKETQLKHGTGIGLWIVQWVVDQSNITVEYETSPDGTEVTLQVPRAA
jgi:signal transduction histidine kinase